MTNERAKSELMQIYMSLSEEKKKALDIAIKALEQEPCDVFDEYGNYKYPSDVELTEPNTATSMPCEDAISRPELLKAIDTWDKFGFDHTGCFVREPKDDFITYIHYDDVIKCIKGMPSVKQEPKTGHWIMKHRTINEVKYHTGLDDMGEEHTIKELIRYEVDEPYCSECGMKAGDTSQNYCCFCGTKMGGEQHG